MTSQGVAGACATNEDVSGVHVIRAMAVVTKKCRMAVEHFLDPHISYIYCYILHTLWLLCAHRRYSGTSLLRTL